MNNYRAYFLSFLGPLSFLLGCLTVMASADTNDYPILTPKPPRARRIHGPTVYGARPGNPFLEWMLQHVPTDKLVLRKWLKAGYVENRNLGRRLHLAACEHGLRRARQKLAVSDGAPWIWNVVYDRWPSAVEVLDFYHASQQVWTLGEAVWGERVAASSGRPRGSGIFAR